MVAAPPRTHGAWVVLLAWVMACAPQGDFGGAATVVGQDSSDSAADATSGEVTGDEGAAATGETGGVEPEASLWWGFEGTIVPGGQVPDQTGNGYTGTVLASEVEAAVSPSGTAARFAVTVTSPIEDLGLVGSDVPAAVASTGDFTVELWAAYEIGGTASLEWQFEASHHEPPSNGTELLFHMGPSAASLFCSFWPDDPDAPCSGSTAPCEVDPPALADSAWHHYALRWSGALDPTATYFIDGVPGPPSVGCDPVVDETAPHELLFSAIGGGNGVDPVAGSVSADEVVVWPVARTDEEICVAAGRNWTDATGVCEP